MNIQCEQLNMEGKLKKKTKKKNLSRDWKNLVKKNTDAIK